MIYNIIGQENILRLFVKKGMYFLINIFNVLSLATSVATQNKQAKSMGEFQILFAIAIVILMFFFMSRSQKKKEKEVEKLRSNIDIGDEIVTIGGIIGTVVSLKDDFIVIETSGDRNKIRINRWAIHTNNTALERETKESITKNKK